MAASYPKSDSERVTRHKPKFEWVDLPAEGRLDPPPGLPKWRNWHPSTRKWWSQMWAKPQALMWEQDGSTLVPLACLYDDLIAGRATIVQVSAEMRQHEDRHGLNPKAMLQLRWRIVGDEVKAARAERTPKARLQAVDSGAVART